MIGYLLYPYTLRVLSLRQVDFLLVLKVFRHSSQSVLLVEPDVVILCNHVYTGYYIYVIIIHYIVFFLKNR